MSVLVFAEGSEGQIKNSSLEAVSYAALLAEKLNGKAVATVIGSYTNEALSAIGKAGVTKVLHVADEKLAKPMAMPYASVLAEIAQRENAEVVLLPRSSLCDSIAGRLAKKLDASIATGVTELPDISSGFRVKKSIYTGKAYAWIELTSKVKILTLAKNAVAPMQKDSAISVEQLQISVPDGDMAARITQTEKATGDILLTEARIVVSGGRGLKGPENWHLVTELAKALGAATGCSKPVSDMNWRPHHEHVGQTGVKVSPDLYIAIGISGAIQHLAGVNTSKYIVVINNDADAPFFKAADYGIVGDAFQVVPKLIEAAKKLK
ncbi:MAG: electron transfer flavoprotein subunit alpha/FixB family protein [Cytophagaceae bacterium]|nr:electron transfer flavoprotein subunit alpha/FixB family protein [Cytophagaceae bacterium]MDW8456234.1 electron transfer flavoprotein subunit alpha/FixB family protein [Cytophagaceae bacterium]